MDTVHSRRSTIVATLIPIDETRWQLRSRNGLHLADIAAATTAEAHAHSRRLLAATHPAVRQPTQLRFDSARRTRCSLRAPETTPQASQAHTTITFDQHATTHEEPSP